ncbi:MAG TPA: phospholipid carrier-dependent glycosyltransferase [Candidatus Acidoferrales bacterium]|nr:phospholipid carrier-dependent glycosyltransferase [Candidatus Acidoferrales bacterium]
MSAPVAPTPVEHRKSPKINLRLFVFIVLALVCGAIVRSAIATRLDGFTIDEAYHIAAGVSYVRYADFRINPEHPPLVKLWVGSLISATGFHQSSIRQFTDKRDERNFTEEDVYLNNDFNSVQRRARIAMWTLNGLLLVALAFAVRRTLGPGIALGTLLFLAIDPTVAAHLPVVMTDLPVSLLSATAVILAARAFRNWAWTDLVACSVALGLALATKHSAPIFFVFIVSVGAILALARPDSRPENSRFSRLAKLSAVAAGALIILWGFYFFRFAESNTGREVFNRPLADKIADVRSPAYCFVLNAMTTSHVVPRAYIWGFADTIRAGLEGRVIPIRAFGRAYMGTAPRYFFPAMIALKLPIGLSVLVIIGLFLFFARRLPRERYVGLAIILAASVLFLLVLSAGSTYGGIRHALPVVVLLAIFGGAAVQVALSSNSKALKSAVAVALVAAAASALPVMRPWEYFNELIGGAKNGYLYFSDEGVDLGQRGKELGEYYHRVLEPSGEVPIVFYGPIGDIEEKALGLDWLGRDGKRDETRLSSPTFSGTVLIDARFLGKFPFWDNSSLRNTPLSARFGNLIVLRGKCACGAVLASGPYEDAVSAIYAEKPDLEEAERLLRQSLAFDPSPFFVHIELGNVCLKRGSRDCALQAYSDALQRIRGDSEFQRAIEGQIKRVSTEPVGQVPELRDPFLE